MPLCPRCGGSIGLDTAVCPGCRFAPALGSEVNLTPPRAARSDPDFEMPPLRRTRVRRPWRWWQLALIAIVPGLGHWLDAQPRPARVFAGGVLGGVLLALLLPFPVLAALLVSLASGLHAYSILDLTPWRQAELLPRFLALIGFSLLCGLLWSLALGFGSTFSMGTLSMPRSVWNSGGALATGLLLMLGVALVIGFGFLIARWLTRPRS